MTKSAKKIFHLILKPFTLFWRLSLKKKIFIIILIITIISIISIQIQNANKKDKYIQETPKYTSLTEIVSESGAIKADGQIDIKSPTNGKIEKLFVQNDQNVTTGQKLFTVKSSATDQEKQAALASYLAAKANLNSQEALANTLRSLMYTKWKTYLDIATSSTYENDDDSPKDQERLSSAEFQSAQEDWNAAEKNYKDQQTAISAAKAETSSTYLAWQATQNATVTAPVSGIIKNIAVSSGNSVTASLPTAPAPPVLSIINSNALIAVIDVGQTEISKVESSQKADLYPDAYKDKTYKGKVIREDDLGTNVNGVIVYRTYIEITNPDENLKSGMTLDADIITKELKSALTVPNSAIVPYKGGKAVRKLNDKNEIEFIPVSIGSKGESRTQILNGLTEDQKIIISISEDQAKGQGLLGL